MDINDYLLCGFILSLGFILYLVWKLYRVREQISFIKDALGDIKNGNLNRRILSQENDITKQICYGINEIAIITAVFGVSGYYETSVQELIYCIISLSLCGCLAVVLLAGLNHSQKGKIHEKKII